MKKIFLLFITSLLLTACGPSEAEQLTKEKNTLTKEVEHLKEKVENEKTKHISKNNTLKNIDNELKQAKSGHTITNDLYTQNFKAYTTRLATAFKTYSDIEGKIDQLKGDALVSDRLSDVKQTIDDAVQTYEAPFKKANPPKTFEEIHDQIQHANKHMKKAISKIEKGYDKKDKTLVSEGKATLQKVIDQFNEIQFQ